MKKNCGKKFGEKVKEGTMNTSNSLWSIKTWLFAMIMSIGMILGTMTAAGAAPGDISGTVYNDVDNNLATKPGLGDYGVSGAVVGLYDSTGTTEIKNAGTHITATTDSTGKYTLTAITNGSYTVKVVSAPAGYAAVAGGEATGILLTGAGAGLSTNTTAHISIRGLGGSLSGKVYGDINLSGAYDGGDDLIGSIKVYLTGDAVTSVTTASNGEYIFHNLPGGNFNLNVLNTELVGAGGYNIYNSVDGTANTPKQTITVALSADISGKDFQARKRSAGIKGNMVVDTNQNLQYNPGTDFLFDGAKVALFYKDGVTPVANYSELTVTGGSYEFAGVPLGEYVVKATNIPAGDYILFGSQAGAGSNSISIGMTTSGMGTYYPDNNFYVIGDPNSTTLVTISGSIFGRTAGNFSTAAGPDGGGTANNTYNSSNDTAFNGVKVDLYKDGSLYLTTETSGTGKYSFSALPPASYVVKMDSTSSAIPANFKFVNDTDGKSPTPVSGSPNAPYEIELGSLAGGAKKTEQNFWYGTGTFGLGLRTYDPIHWNTHYWGSMVNGLGLGSYIPAVKVVYYEEDRVTPAYDVNGNPVTLAGSQRLTNRFFPGNYWGEIDLSTVPAGMNAVWDGNAYSYATTTEAYKYALVRGDYGISGRLWVDMPGGTAGVYDDGVDVPLRGVRIGISGPIATNVITTNADGTYRFTNLPPGTYQLTRRTDYLSGVYDGYGDQINFVSDSGGSTIAVGGILPVTVGPSVVDQNMWFEPKNADFYIQGTAYQDIYNYGVLTIVENHQKNDIPLADTTIELWNKDTNTHISTVTTGTDGKYQFTGLTGSTTYTIKAYKAGNLVMTIPQGGGERDITFGPTPGIYEDQDFLLQGANRLAVRFSLDTNGNGSHDGTAELAGGSGEWLALKKWNPNTSTWVNIKTDMYTQTANPYEWRLEDGKYQVSLNRWWHYARVAVANNYRDASDTRGVVEVNLSGGQTINDAFVVVEARNGSNTNATGPIAGGVYLDTNNNGIIDADDILLTGLSGTTVDYYYTDRFHPDYNSAAQLAANDGSPIVSVPVGADGTFTTTLGSTSFLLKLKGLPSDYELVTNSGPATASYLPASYQGLDTIQVAKAVGASTISNNYLVKYVNERYISGYVMYDRNYDDNFSGEDAPITGVKVQLWRNGSLYAEQDIQSDGTYKFSSMIDGNYEVKLKNEPDASYKKAPNSLALDGSRTVTINSANPIASGKNFSFWYNLDGAVGIAGRVALDINDTGALEVGQDFFLQGFTTTLHSGSASGPQVGSAITTDSGGNFLFDSLAPGTYYVKITPPAGYSVITNSEGNSTNAIKVVVSSSMVVGEYFLVKGNSPTGVSGILFQGTTNTPAAPYVGGATVQLIEAATGKVMGSYTTNSSDGKYQFYNLLAGPNYTVKLTQSASGYAARGDVDGAPVGEIAVTGLTTSGISGQNIWFAVVSPTGIQGSVQYRANTAPVLDVAVSGITVELYDKNYPPSGGYAPLSTTTTDATGAYKFENIATMDYIVKVKDTDKTAKNYVDLSPTSPGEITINALPVAGSIGHGFVLNGTQEISGKLWLDENGDEAYDSLDTLVGPANVTLVMPGADGILGTGDDIDIRTVATVSGTGTYQFANLPSGDYRIKIDTTTSTFDGVVIIPTTSLAGNDLPRNISLTTTQNNVDFGFKYNGSISGTIYQDIDGDGARSMVDTAFGGMTVTLQNTAGTKTYTTIALAADGTYSFANVPIDNWKISAAPTGYNFSFGEGGAVVGSTVEVAITSASSSASGVNLGFTGTGKISGKIVLDNDLTDGNNATSVDTPVASSVKVLLSGSGGFISREVIANASGEFEISDLSPYTYTVGVKTAAADGFPTGLIISFDPVNGMVGASNSVSITVPAAMTTIVNQDFGYKGRGEISGKILVDIEGAGTYTAADYSLGSGITVTAKNGSIVRTTTTNGSGEYSFNSLPTGVWEIYLANADIPTNYTFSYGENGTVTSRGVNVDIDSAITRSPVLKAENIHLGYRGSSVISGRLLYDNDDTDGNLYSSGVDTLFGAGYTVTLSGGSGFTPVTTTTNASGGYEFTGLSVYADYKVTVTSPTGYIASFDPDSAAVTPPAIPVGDGEAIIPITTAIELKTLQDFAFKGAGKIAGKIYIDLNDNGTYESAVDQPKSGITVTLTHATLPARTATTDSSGDYVVTGIPAGEWTAMITGGTSGLRSPSFDYDDAYDPTGTPATPLQAVVQLTSGSPIEEHVDFGFINRGKLEGVIKEDSLATGLYDPAAPGISGVTVHLVENDGVTPKTYADGTPIVLTTDANGSFVARNLDCPTTGGTYSIKVEFGPNSIGPLNMMEPSYDSDTLGAGCGSGVNLSTGTHVVNADLAAATAFRTPADLHLGYKVLAGDILIIKKAAKPTAKIGDIVPYTIEIKNQRDIVALNLTLEDLIPAGFKYVDGSARLDGEKIEDPSGNRPLLFKNIDLDKAGTEKGERKLSYFLVVGSGVTQGEYTNTAVAKNSVNRVASNVSQATVEITSDPLFDDSLIFGKVYIDANGNGEQDVEEEGLGGIKLATGRGEIITTDEHGRYHIPAVDGGRWERGRNFILKLDVRSLPAGYKVISDNPIVVRTSPGLPSKINFRVKEVEAQETKIE